MKSSPQSGNILFYILLAIVLIGFVTVALRDNGGLDSNVDKESDTVKASQMIKYSGEVAEAVRIILDDGASENDLRFSHPQAHAAYGTIANTPPKQVFSSQGGKALYRKPPAGVASPASTNYEFSAEMAIPGVGSDKADLFITVYPITDGVCKAVNKLVGVTTTPEISNCPPSPRFIGAYSNPPLVPAYTTAPANPQPNACVRCTNGSFNLYYYVLLAR